MYRRFIVTSNRDTVYVNRIGRLALSHRFSVRRFRLRAGSTLKKQKKKNTRLRKTELQLKSVETTTIRTSQSLAFENLFRTIRFDQS